MAVEPAWTCCCTACNRWLGIGYTAAVALGMSTSRLDSGRSGLCLHPGCSCGDGDASRHQSHAGHRAKATCLLEYCGGSPSGRVQMKSMSCKAACCVVVVAGAAGAGVDAVGAREAQEVVAAGTFVVGFAGVGIVAAARNTGCLAPSRVL